VAEQNPPKYGVAYKAFSEGEAGAEACQAIDSLVKMSSIDTLLSNFIVPLQHEVDPNNRIHASLNINTETGRLSCRRPNLQNQPALEKDMYVAPSCVCVCGGACACAHGWC
jgi:DNA polymerase-1